MIRLNLAPFTRVWRKTEYRAFFILLVLMSLATSSTVPVVSLYLVRNVGVSLSMAGLFFTSMALPGIVLSVLVGRWSDRWRSRLPFMRFVVVWVALGWLVFALSPYRWLTLSVGVVFLSVGGGLMAQVFAALHDVMTRDREEQPAMVNTVVRTGFSFGFVFGPLIGGALAARTNFHVPFIAAACLYLVCLVPLRGMNVTVPERVGSPETVEGAGRPGLLLVGFTALCALVLSGTTIKNTYLPIDVTTHLGANVAAYGTILAISPIVELFVMPLAGVLAERMSIGLLISGGLVLAVLEYVFLTLSTSLWQLYAIQAMDASVVAVVMGLGVTYAQELSPDRPGLASGLFLSTFNVSMVLGGLVGSLAVPFLGVPHVFAIPAALCLASWLAFLSIDRVAHIHSRPHLSPESAALAQSSGEL